MECAQGIARFYFRLSTEYMFEWERPVWDSRKRSPLPRVFPYLQAVRARACFESRKAVASASFLSFVRVQFENQALVASDMILFLSTDRASWEREFSKRSSASPTGRSVRLWRWRWSNLSGRLATEVCNSKLTQRLGTTICLWKREWSKDNVTFEAVLICWNETCNYLPKFPVRTPKARCRYRKWSHKDFGCKNQWFLYKYWCKKKDY